MTALYLDTYVGCNESAHIQNWNSSDEGRISLFEQIMNFFR